MKTILLLLLLLPSIALAQSATPTPDPGWCGVYPFQTGIWDPFHEICITHDARFNQNKQRIPDVGFAQTTGEFCRDVAVEGAKGVYAAVMAPIYITLGTVIGGLLWGIGSLRRKKDDE